MNTLRIIIQLVIALGIYNVWLVRFNKETAYRGKKAKSMKGEFSAYGLPDWSVYAVGGLKLIAATALIVGIGATELIFPAAIIMVILMIGAIGMHIKVRDSLIKSVPALGVLILSALLIILPLI